MDNIKHCARCQKPFLFNHRYPNRKYCSKVCRLVGRIRKRCELCNEAIVFTEGQKRLHKARFCSPECLYAAPYVVTRPKTPDEAKEDAARQANCKWRTCDQCQQKYRRPRSRNKVAQFCSQACYFASKKQAADLAMAQPCISCGKSGGIKRKGLCDGCRARQYHRRIKAETFGVYGGQCACCGERQLEFLSLDHINNDGSDQRRQLAVKHGYRLTGVTFWLLLRRQGYPKDLQVLCFNCNMAKAFLGYCPHWQSEP